MSGNADPLVRKAFDAFLRAQELEGEPQAVRDRMWQAFCWAWSPTGPGWIRVILDGPPLGPEGGGRFIDIEDVNGRPARVGSWTQRADGKWVLLINRVSLQ